MLDACRMPAMIVAISAVEPCRDAAVTRTFMT